MEFFEILRDLTDASKTPSRSRPEHLKNIRPRVEKLTSITYKEGLLPEALEQLLDIVIVQSHLDQASLSAITKNLYPRTKVPAELILKVVGSLGHGQLKPTLAIQALLLKWMIMVYHVIDKPFVLSQVYSVLYNLLETAVIRPQLCHILALTTRRKHVRPWRIQALVELSHRTAGEPAVSGLLKVYKEYYPEVIARLDGKPSVFKHPNPEWRAHLDDLQEFHRKQEQEASSTQNGFRVFRPTQLKGVLPHAVTPRAPEDAFTLEEIGSAWDLVKNLEKIPLPSQLVAVLSDPLLQKLAFLRHDVEAEVEQRANDWIIAFLDDVASGEIDKSELEAVLGVMKDFVLSTKCTPSSFLLFIQTLLRTWQGDVGRQHIFQILARVPLISFEELYKHIIGQLLEILSVKEGPIAGKFHVLSLYSNILRHWLNTARLLERAILVQHQVRISISDLVANANDLALALICPNDAAFTTSSVSEIYIHQAILDYLALFGSAITDPKLQPFLHIVIPPGPVAYRLFFSPSLAVVSGICDVLSQYKKAFEKVMQRPNSNSPGGIRSRPQSQSHSQLQLQTEKSGDTSSLSQVQIRSSSQVTGGTGPQLGVGNQNLASQRPSSTHTLASLRPHQYDASYVNRFNGYLMDCCNCIWRGRAFNTTDQNAQGCCIRPTYAKVLNSYIASLHQGLSLHTLFTLSYNPILALESIEVIREKEVEEIERGENSQLVTRHAGPATQESLKTLVQQGGIRVSWASYRVEVLSRLENKGAGGVATMMYNTMKNLMGSRKSIGA